MKATLDGVNEPMDYYLANDPPKPVLPENEQKREVLLVDRNGRPLLVKEPRPIGFRKP